MNLDALLAAVLAEPFSDEPRLAYADALAAAGEGERATAIRRAVEAAQRWTQLGEGAPERNAYGGWIEYPVGKPGGSDVQWGIRQGLGGAWQVWERRGFVESASVGPATGDDLTRAGALHPIVALCLRGPGGDGGRALSAQLAPRWMGRLVHLALREFNKKDGVGGALGATQHLSHLERLHLWGCAMDDAAMKALATAALPALRQLHITGGTFKAGGLKAVLEAWGDGLTHLSLRECKLDLKLVTALSGLPQLRELVLDGKTGEMVDDAVVAALCEAPLPALSNLSFPTTRLSSEVQAQLAQRLPPLRLEAVEVRDGGREVRCRVTNERPLSRELLPPWLEGGGARIGSVPVIDGVRRNAFDPFSIGAGASREVGVSLDAATLARHAGQKLVLHIGDAATQIALP